MLPLLTWSELPSTQKVAVEGYVLPLIVATIISWLPIADQVQEAPANDFCKIAVSTVQLHPPSALSMQVYSLMDLNCAHVGGGTPKSLGGQLAGSVYRAMPAQE